MSILDELNQRIIEEYKTGQTETRVFLQTLKSALMAKEKDKREPLTQSEEIQVLKSELKKEEETLLQAKSASREDIANKAESEISIIKSYLPEEMPDSVIEDTVKSIVDASEDKAFGNIMKLAMQELRGQADGARVSQIVKKFAQ